jgi:hypothetical protein
MAKGTSYVALTAAQEKAVSTLLDRYTVRAILEEPKIALEVFNFHRQRVVIIMDADGVITKVELHEK